MKFAVITHVSHIKHAGKFYAYAPYVREINLWAKTVDEIILVAPLENKIPDSIDDFYSNQAIQFKVIPKFDIKSLHSIFKTIFKVPVIFIAIFKAMRNADHIHLRCPGNIGLLGCFAQIFFPNKPKTAKYAGNWPLNANQPLSYKLQKWILGNTFLTKNMQVLVYGEWPSQSKNVKPFFTATYSESEKKPLIEKTINGLIQFLFVGTLSDGKRPLYAVQLVQKLIEKGIQVQLEFFGEGEERQKIEEYIKQYNLESVIFLKGNQNKETIQQAYEESHFLILPSKSEGWPKVVAEAMFWGCVPVSTNVSCVPTMLDDEKRGLLLEMNLDSDLEKIVALINNPVEYQSKRNKAVIWSRNFTLENFEIEIQKLLKA